MPPRGATIGAASGLEGKSTIFDSNLILAGFMGTGKTTVGRLVAEVLGMPFFDTDLAIEERVGARIPEIFANSGEAIFRKLESVVCLEAAIYGGLVIATGGGAFMNPSTREALRDTGLVICLDADIEDVIRRLGDDSGRPLARDPDALAALYEARREIYDELPIHVDTSGRSLEDVAAEVIALWQLYNS